MGLVVLVEHCFCLQRSFSKCLQCLVQLMTDLHGRLGQRSGPDVGEVLVDDTVAVRDVTAVLRRTLARQQVLHLLLVSVKATTTIC